MHFAQQALVLLFLILLIFKNRSNRKRKVKNSAITADGHLPMMAGIRFIRKKHEKSRSYERQV